MSNAHAFDAVMRSLLSGQRVASLATVDEGGMPHASLVPFAVNRERGTLVIHISGLSPHFGYLVAKPRAALLIATPEMADAEVHALPRMSIDGTATFVSGSDDIYAVTRSAYLSRFPEVTFMTELPDFSFVEISPESGRVIAGFGAAKKLDRDRLVTAIRNT